MGAQKVNRKDGIGIQVSGQLQNNVTYATGRTSLSLLNVYEIKDSFPSPMKSRDCVPPPP